MTSPFYHQPSHSLTLIFYLVSIQTLFPPFHDMPPHLWTFLLLLPALTSGQGPPIHHNSSTAPQLTSQLSYSHPVILHIHPHYALRQYTSSPLSILLHSFSKTFFAKISVNHFNNKPHCSLQKLLSVLASNTIPITSVQGSSTLLFCSCQKIALILRNWNQHASLLSLTL